MQPPFAQYTAREGAPVSALLADQVISLPMYPQLAPSDVGRVVEAIEEFVAAEDGS
jgi:dTDP-4-amino-4,6-dideoxygalactose transaminase